jgi:small subunit ribosomal protein S6e
LKVVYSDPKTGRTGEVEVQKEVAVQFVNVKIGDLIEGSPFGLAGYKLKVTGGSDTSGFPMSRSIAGTRKTHIFKGRRTGKMSRHTVVGNTVAATTAQINTVIVEYGAKAVDEIMPAKKEKPKEEKAAEKPKGKK